MSIAKTGIHLSWLPMVDRTKGRYLQRVLGPQFSGR